MPNATNAGWWLEFGNFPKGDPSSSPGLLYSATLGQAASESRNANGVVTKPCLRTPTLRNGFDVGRCRNPVGVRGTLLPKVAEYSNLGFGLQPLRG